MAARSRFAHDRGAPARASSPGVFEHEASVSAAATAANPAQPGIDPLSRLIAKDDMPGEDLHHPAGGVTRSAAVTAISRKGILGGNHQPAAQEIVAAIAPGAFAQRDRRAAAGPQNKRLLDASGRIRKQKMVQKRTSYREDSR
jgi:hypothetical protein